MLLSLVPFDWLSWCAYAKLSQLEQTILPLHLVWLVCANIVFTSFKTNANNFTTSGVNLFVHIAAFTSFQTDSKNFTACTVSLFVHIDVSNVLSYESSEFMERLVYYPVPCCSLSIVIMHNDVHTIS
jgi:hypothetical protein